MRNKLFASLLLLALVLGVGTISLPQRSESAREKRVLATNEKIAFNDLSKTTEEVLKDQFPGRDEIIHRYYQARIALNKMNDKLMMLPVNMIKTLMGKETEEDTYGFDDLKLTYLAEGTIELRDSYLISAILDYDEEEKNDAWARGDNVNKFDLKYPDIKTYVYFPTRIEELLNPEYVYEAVCRQWFCEQLNPGIKYASFKLNDLRDHQRYFFRTDLHWNAYGAYEGYKDIINMINEDFPIGTPHAIKEKIVYPYVFYGNVSDQLGGYGVGDQISDLILEDIGDFDYYVDGEKSDYYASKEQYKEKGNPTIFSDYHVYFGENNFLRVFDFHNEDKPNLLFFGDSYKNTNMMWIASHFNKTIIIDLRSRPEDFDLDACIADYDIDVALISYHYLYAYFDGHMFIPLD